MPGYDRCLYVLSEYVCSVITTWRDKEFTTRRLRL